MDEPTNAEPHRLLRLITCRWPHPFAAAAINILLERFLPRTGGPNWVDAPPCDPCPPMALDLADRLQRKTYYFPRAYARYYLHAPLARAMRLLLSPGDWFVDVGANIGFYSLLAARLVGRGGGVWAFEPQPGPMESLCRSARLGGLDQLRCFQMALSDREEELVLHCDPNGLCSSLVDEHPRRRRRYSSEIRVRTDSLDHLAGAMGLEAQRIRLIKVDVEGEEPRTIAGMLGTLERAGGPAVWCEVRGPRGSTRAPNTFEAVRERLAPLGYRAHRGDGTPLLPRDLLARGSQNVLFRRVA